MFPFDELSCPIEMGGWATSGTTQGLMEDSVSGCVDSSLNSEEVSMSSYTEYLIEHVACELEVLEYASFPGERWPVMRYRIFLQRASLYYVYTALIPSIVFALLSFGVFFMSFQVAPDGVLMAF